MSSNVFEVISDNPYKKHGQNCQRKKRQQRLLQKETALSREERRTWARRGDDGQVTPAASRSSRQVKTAAWTPILFMLDVFRGIIRTVGEGRGVNGEGWCSKKMTYVFVCTF